MRRVGIVTIVIMLMLTFNGTAQRIGYIVSIDDKDSIDSRFFKTQCVETLEKSIYLNTGLDIDVDEVFEGDNVFFEYRINGLSYYVEKKIVERKKNGKLDYRKISKKERKEMARG